jgi:dTDP-4-amino-4,6-dideoxygalactose transaminase
MQPIFSKSEFVGGTVAENLFEKAICLPSGSKLTDEEVQRVVDQLVSIG